MEVHFTPEQEAQLAQIATEAGTDAERLVKRLVAEELTLSFVPEPDLAFVHFHHAGPNRHHVAGIVDHVSVVASPANQRIETCAAIEIVVSRAAADGGDGSLGLCPASTRNVFG